MELGWRGVGTISGVWTAIPVSDLGGDGEERRPGRRLR